MMQNLHETIFLVEPYPKEPPGIDCSVFMLYLLKAIILPFSRVDLQLAI